MKWVLIGLGGLVLFQLYRQSQESSNPSGGFLSGGKGGGTLGGASGLINSLSSLTTSVGHLFGKGSSSTSNRDALITPTF